MAVSPAVRGAPHEAAGANAELEQLFFTRDTDPKIRSKPGVTALDFARQYNNTAAIEILEKLK